MLNTATDNIFYHTHPKIPAPYCCRCAYHLSYPACNLECARSLEKTIMEQGPENVDTIVTELAVIDVAEKGLNLREIASENDLETVIKKTGAPLIIPDRELPLF